MKIGLIGFGAIGSHIARQMKKDVAWVVDADKSAKAKMASAGLKCKFFGSIPEECAGADLVVEAASQGAVPMLHECLPFCDVMIMSVGALANKKLLVQLSVLAKEYGRKIYLPSGAIGGLDSIASADGKIRSVLLETTKDPKSLGRNDAKRTVVFEGSARQACKLYPKNVNVAATLSLAGVGFEKTKVRIVSDPKAKRNMHCITVESESGSMQFRFENEPFAENPKTSALAALSAISRIKKIDSAIQIG
ncbi:MAG: aspartate dehydrogenase [Candidatus Micrarchaeota archaeon]|nr:aspartate dehydrogenase [Candidatus Micrarchaeota archaeon]